MKSDQDPCETQKVEQNEVGFCNKPILFYTDGLGPCIGVCIAWAGWAGILHTADIFLDEADEMEQLIEKAREIIPDATIAKIHPILCGGDIQDPDAISENPKEDAKYIVKCRRRVVSILKKAGFGKPRCLWSNEGQTAALVANLGKSVVFVEHDGEEVGCWPILQDE